jgi:DNA invertase Pin-like site-specific DNA recombinase
MPTSLIVRDSTEPTRIRTRGRAAQYVRMSTEHQRYSIQNQAAVIAAYAAQHDLTIVRTYADEGRSGLRIVNRTSLIELLNDVRSGHATFEHILVYDVSRWGRFQDTDESAHYEFLCKQAGIKIAYCAEQFDNDGSLMSSIVKNLKRVMAAEYSRELSVKVLAGSCRVASMGFRSGALPSYGLHRVLIDEKGVSKGLLKKGQTKHLQVDRVVVRPGSQHERDIINRIFRRFVYEGKTQAEIVRQLNAEKVPNHRHRIWTAGMIRWMLQNETYIGNLVYNRISNTLHQGARKNSPERWVRCKGMFEPIVSPELFAQAQQIMEEDYLRLSNDELLERLRILLVKRGRLTAALLDDTPGAPSSSVYVNRFGSIRNAFRLIGYSSRRQCDYIDARALLEAKLLDVVAATTRRLEELGAQAEFDEGTHTMVVNTRLAVSFRVARHYRFAGKTPMWHVFRRCYLPAGLIAALRMDAANANIIDYLVLPTTEMRKQRISVSDSAGSRLGTYRVATLDGVISAIMATLSSTSPVLPASAGSRKTRRRAPRTRKAICRVRR